MAHVVNAPFGKAQRAADKLARLILEAGDTLGPVKVVGPTSGAVLAHICRKIQEEEHPYLLTKAVLLHRHVVPQEMRLAALKSRARYYDQVRTGHAANCILEEARKTTSNSGRTAGRGS